MKKRIVAIILLLVLIFLGGCQSVKSCSRDVGSMGAGLIREVTLYSADGTIIGQWSGKIYVDTTDGIASFINENNKRIILSGTYVIEEK